MDLLGDLFHAPDRFMVRLDFFPQLRLGEAEVVVLLGHFAEERIDLVEDVGIVGLLALLDGVQGLGVVARIRYGEEGLDAGALEPGGQADRAGRGDRGAGAVPRQAFLAALASNPAWALPPWPVFGALAVLTLALSTAALLTRSPGLHAAGAVAASTVMASWSTAATAPPYGFVALIGAAVVSAYAVGWIHLWPWAGRTAGVAAGCVFFVAEAVGEAIAAELPASPRHTVVAAIVVVAFALGLSQRLGLQSGLDFVHIDWGAGTFDAQHAGYFRIGAALVSKHLIGWAVVLLAILGPMPPAWRAPVVRVIQRS